MIAGTERDLLLAFDPQPGGAFDEQHPFVPRLIVGRVRRRRVAARDDSLDADPRAFEEGGEQLVGPIGGRGGQELGGPEGPPLRAARTKAAAAVEG